MIQETILSDNQKFSIHVGIKTEGKKRLRVVVSDSGKRNSNYVDRSITCDGDRRIFFNFPVTPKSMTMSIVNLDDTQDKNIQITLLRMPLKSWNIWLDPQTTEFLNLAMPFAQRCGFEQATPQGRIFTNNTKQFTIKYFDIIRDYQTGRLMNTPARIGHSTGRIEVAKVKFDKYTIPMRMAILLHEYSHVFKNPNVGLEIKNEVGADINGLYIYLGLGFSKIDAICVYANVFLKAQTKGNVERMRKIMDYIAKFENGDFAHKNKNV